MTTKAPRAQITEEMSKLIALLSRLGFYVDVRLTPDLGGHIKWEKQKEV